MRERGFSTYGELQRWSVEDLDGFWGSIWDRFSVGERSDVVLGVAVDARRVVVSRARRSTTPSTRSGGARMTRSR